MGRHLLEVIAPEVAEAKLAAILAGQEDRDRRLRECRITPDGTGRHHLSGWLDALGAATVHAALTPLCTPCPGPDGQPDPRPAATRHADALVEICRRALHHGDLPTTGGDKPHLTVTIPYQVLLHRIGHGSLDTGDPISPHLARHLACDAAITPAVLDSASYPLDVGRTTRTVTGPLRRAVILRDRTCVFPGCDRPPAWCDIHHTTIHTTDWTIRIATDKHPETIPPPG